MRYLAYALVLMFGFADLVAAQPYELRVSAEWTHEGGADDFVLYLCDQPITGEFGGNLADESLIGKCEGALTKVEIPGTQRQAAVTCSMSKKQGTLYARISARKKQKVGGVDRVLETDLSQQTTLVYDLDDVTEIDRGEAPVIIDVTRIKEIVIR